MNRNYGIDLLRMILMYMVVVLHILGHGGVLDAAVPMSEQYCAAFLLESLAYCAVNGYGIITGYVYSGRTPRMASLVQLWLQAEVYSLGIAVCVWLLKPQYFTLGMLLNQSLPVYREAYWYLSSYVGLFLLIPFLNWYLQYVSVKQARYFVLLSFVLISVLPTALGGDPFNLQGGYSTAWLVYLYLLGACIRKFEWGKDVSKARGIWVFLLSAALTWFAKLAMDALTIRIFSERRDYLNPYSYTSPTVILAAVSLLLVFRNMKLPPKLQTLVAALSPATFGVYLIHEQTYFKGYFIHDRFIMLADLHPGIMVASVLAIAIGVFVVCIAVDYVRCRFFVWLRVREKLDVLESCLKNYLTKAKQEGD